MKRLGVTQRVVSVSDRGERRDSLDQRWSTMCQVLGFALMPLPNIDPSAVGDYLDSMDLAGVILSGGNSLSAVDAKSPDAAPERDAFEFALLDEVVRRSIPAIGVCRGMQVVNVYFGGTLVAVANHAGCRHDLSVARGFEPLIDVHVNSFHDWTIAGDGVADGFVPVAFDGVGNVEAFVHDSLAISGIMWHPEREDPPRERDLAFLKRYLK